MGNSAPPVPQIDPPVHPPSPFFPSESHSPKARGSFPLGAPRPVPAPNVQRSLDARKSPPIPPPLEPEPQLADDSPPLLDTRAEPPDLPWPEPRQISGSFQDTFPDEAPPTSVTLTETHSGMGAAAAGMPSSVAALGEPGSQRLALLAGIREGTLDEREPSPEAVLEALASVGLYEPAGAVTPAWETPATPAPRRLWVLGAAVATAVALGLGGYQYARRVQSERLAQAQELAAHVTGLLAGASVRDLQSSESDFQHLFDLDSRSRDAAVLWLRNRALQTLVADEPAPGIESALERARSVGIDEAELVFGRVASALAAGDLPGATQQITLWDERAKGQALFQLFAGAVFERAGNPDALQRFQRAAALEPDLKLAHLLA
ncbi:MAG TPA: hypothetical protein VG963_23320, partial [Polyangiaceae bacterium]|nr:hypothetical protein [Polyangiaceae bacterium]